MEVNQHSRRLSSHSTQVVGQPGANNSRRKSCHPLRSFLTTLLLMQIRSKMIIVQRLIILRPVHLHLSSHMIKLSSNKKVNWSLTHHSTPSQNFPAPNLWMMRKKASQMRMKWLKWIIPQHSWWLKTTSRQWNRMQWWLTPTALVGSLSKRLRKQPRWLLTIKRNTMYSRSVI